MYNLLYRQATKDDLFYQNGQLGQKGYITTLSEAKLIEKGIYLVLKLPKWVDVTELTKGIDHVK